MVFQINILNKGSMAVAQVDIYVKIYALDIQYTFIWKRHIPYMKLFHFLGVIERLHIYVCTSYAPTVYLHILLLWIFNIQITNLELFCLL